MVDQLLLSKNDTTQLFARSQQGLLMIDQADQAVESTATTMTIRRTFGLLPAAVVTYIGTALGGPTLLTTPSLTYPTARYTHAREPELWGVKTELPAATEFASTVADRVVVELSRLE